MPIESGGTGPGVRGVPHRPALPAGRDQRRLPGPAGPRGRRRAPCGVCRSCRRGRPWYRFDSRNAAQPMTLADGTPLSPAIGIGAFTAHTLVAAGQAVKVDPSVDPAAAGLIGCGVVADPVEVIRALTEGNGADVVVEAVGRPETYRQAFDARDLAGTLVQVGVPDPSMRVELGLIDLFSRGGAAKMERGDVLRSVVVLV